MGERRRESRINSEELMETKMGKEN